MRSNYLVGMGFLFGVMKMFCNTIVVMLAQKFGDTGEYSKNRLIV